MVTNIKGKLKENRDTILLVFLFSLVVFINFFVYKFGFSFATLVLIFLALVFHKEKIFIKELIGPILLFYMYEFLRAEAYNISKILNRPMLGDTLVMLDKDFFTIDGEMVTVFLQRVGLNLDSFFLNITNYTFFLSYLSLFIFFLLIAFLAWRKSIRIFRKYIYGMIFFSFFSVLFYILFPSIPPWYASEIGLYPDIERIFFAKDYFNFDYVSLVGSYGHNNFAAFPSLHAAWSLYGALWGEYIIGPKGLWLFLVPLIIILGTWYGGEHYVIDSLFGCFLASITFLILVMKKKK